MNPRRTISLFLLLLVSLPILIGGTCGMRYVTFAETRRQFIAMSWILGDWKHNSNASLPVMRWENREPDQYVGMFPCLKFQIDSTHVESIPDSEATLCEYQIVRQDGNIKFDIAARPPSGDVRFLIVGHPFESISHESLREWREFARRATEFKDTTSAEWNSVRVVLLSKDSLLIAAGDQTSQFEKYDTLIRVR